MHQWARPQVRRLLAVATALALLGSVAETLLPDVHDGDAAAITSIQTTGTPTPSQPTRAPDHSPDAPHVCHCIHAHLAALAADERLAPPNAPRLAAPEFRFPAPPAPRATDHFRPPIA